MGVIDGIRGLVGQAQDAYDTFMSGHTITDDDWREFYDKEEEEGTDEYVQRFREKVNQELQSIPIGGENVTLEEYVTWRSLDDPESNTEADIASLTASIQGLPTTERGRQLHGELLTEIRQHVPGGEFANNQGWSDSEFAQIKEAFPYSYNYAIPPRQHGNFDALRKYELLGAMHPSYQGASGGSQYTKFLGGMFDQDTAMNYMAGKSGPMGRAMEANYWHDQATSENNFEKNSGFRWHRDPYSGDAKYQTTSSTNISDYAFADETPGQNQGLFGRMGDQAEGTYGTMSNVTLPFTKNAGTPVDQIRYLQDINRRGNKQVQVLPDNVSPEKMKEHTKFYRDYDNAMEDSYSAKYAKTYGHYPAPIISNLANLPRHLGEPDTLFDVGQMAYTGGVGSVGRQLLEEAFEDSIYGGGIQTAAHPEGASKGFGSYFQSEKVNDFMGQDGLHPSNPGFGDQFQSRSQFWKDELGRMSKEWNELNPQPKKKPYSAPDQSVYYQ